MILQDLTEIWWAKRVSGYDDGDVRETFTDLQAMKANVQVMSNARQLKTYGEIRDGAVGIYTEDPPPFAKGDAVYLRRPESTGTDADGGPLYPPGDFQVDSILPSYTGGYHIHNPTVSTASAVTK